MNQPRTLKSLNKMLTQAFTPTRAPDQFRKSREKSKKLAKQYVIKIEPMKPGFNVWPPAPILDSPDDPFSGDHYAHDWDEVYEHVLKYTEMLQDASNNPEVKAP